MSAILRMDSGADETCTECSNGHEEAQAATDTKERLRKQGRAGKEKAALRFCLLRYSEKGSKKPLKEAQITLETMREAGFQRTAENEDQWHQGGRLSPVVDKAKVSPHWIISCFACVFAWRAWKPDLVGQPKYPNSKKKVVIGQVIKIKRLF